MEQSTSATGHLTKLMGRVNSFTQREMFTMASGWMIMLQAMEFTNIRTEHSTKDSGKMICSMDMGMRSGLMAAVIWEVTLKVKKKERDFINGAMVPTTKGTGSKTKLVEW